MNANDSSAMNSESDHNDDDFAELEKVLRALRPAEPSASLEARVFSLFASETTSDPENVIALPAVESDKILHWFRPIAAAAAVAGVFLGGIWMFRDSGGHETKTAETTTTPVTIRDEYQPVSAGNVFERATDEGVVYPATTSEPMRRVRYQYHDTYEWRHPEDGSLIRLSVPHEETLYLPVETD